MSGPRGLLLVLVDPAPTEEEELNDWYDTEHLPERARLPGFLTALRFTSLGDGPRYAALYDLDTLEALETEAYAAVSGANFSPWTRRVTSRSRPVRLTARQVAGGADPTGRTARLLILRFAGTTDAAPIAAGLEANFASGWRLYAGAEPAPDFMLALVELPGMAVPPLDVAAFGGAARHLTLAAAYRPYRA